MNPEFVRYPKILQALSKTGANHPDLLLDKYPRILQRAESLWGSKEAGIYFDSLLLEDRKAREGFSEDLLSDVWLLKQVHETLFPKFSVSIHDPFNNLDTPEVTGIQSFHAPAEKKSEVGVAGDKLARPAAPSTPTVEASLSRPVVSAPTPAPTEAKQNFWPSVKTLHELYEADEVKRNGGKVYAAQGQKIGEILKYFGLIDENVLEAVEKRHITKKAKDRPTGALLVYLGIIDKDTLTRALCVQGGVIMVDVLSLHIPREIQALVPKAKAHEKQAVVVGANKGTVYVAVADPLNFADHQYFSFTTGMNVSAVYAPRHDIILRHSPKWVDLNSDVWSV